MSERRLLLRQMNGHIVTDDMLLVDCFSTAATQRFQFILYFILFSSVNMFLFIISCIPNAGSFNAS